MCSGQLRRHFFIKCIILSQVSEVSAFTCALVEHCGRRSKGHDARGSTKGSDNDRLAGRMDAVRAASDLSAIQASPSSSVIGTVLVAVSRLHTGGLIPSTVPQDSVRAAYDTLKKLSPANSKVLFKELWSASRTESRLRPFVDLVVRLWLISPTESVVESMASVVKDLFGANRILDHENAVQELIVRWNGPDLAHADWLIGKVLAKNPHLNHFVRGHIGRAVEGTVIARHRAYRNPGSYIHMDYL